MLTDLVVATWNLERGGETDGHWSRFEAALKLWPRRVNPTPHVLLIQEACWGKTQLARFAAAVGASDTRLARRRDPRNRYHLATLVTDPVRIADDGWVSMPHWLDTHLLPAGLARVQAPGWAGLTIANTHLSPFSPELRLIQAAGLTSLADRGDVIVGGDYNTGDDHDRAPDFSGCTRAQITQQQDRTSRWWWRDPLRPDTRAMELLYDAGFRDAADLSADPATARARPTSGVWPQPYAPVNDRRDRLLVSPALAGRVQVVDYRVYDDPGWRTLSDHLPVVVTFRQAGPTA